MALNAGTILSGLIIAWIVNLLGKTLYNATIHPLAKFPGPRTVATGWYKTWQEVFLGRSWFDVLQELHERYGEVVRVGPTELHFSNPTAYHEIYNNANRWDKEHSLYRCFGEDRSSFGYLTHREAKQRKDVLAPLFSRRAILDLQGLVRTNIDRMCAGLARDAAHGRSSDMLFALRAFTLDTIINYCFGQDVGATEAPDFRAPITLAMDATTPAFVVFRHFELLRRAVFGMPGWLTKLTNPALAGLVDLQTRLGAQVAAVVRDGDGALAAAPHPIIYHRLLDPGSAPDGVVPAAGSLYEEAQALLFGGAESSGNTAMLGTFHVLRHREAAARLRAELRGLWPDPAGDVPPLERLERLPYLTAVVKESLRIAPAVPAPLPRVVPATGARLAGCAIPPGTVVGMSLVFVQMSAELFADPERFEPERWLGPGAAALEKGLVAFSRGPRSCLGQNLAMCELYFAFAVLFRRFDLELDGTTEEDLKWKECFLPLFGSKHMRAFCRPVED